MASSKFHHLVNANVLVLAKSSFSYLAGLYNQNIVYYIDFWHTPMPNWININNMDNENINNENINNENINNEEGVITKVNMVNLIILLCFFIFFSIGFLFIYKNLINLRDHM